MSRGWWLGSGCATVGVSSRRFESSKNHWGFTVGGGICRVPQYSLRSRDVPVNGS